MITTKDHQLITVLDYHKGVVVTYDIKEALANHRYYYPEWTFVDIVEYVMAENDHEQEDCHWMSHEKLPILRRWTGALGNIPPKN